MIGSLYDARHKTAKRIHQKIKADAPITIVDVPMLIHLMSQYVGTNTQSTRSEEQLPTLMHKAEKDEQLPDDTTV